MAHLEYAQGMLAWLKSEGGYVHPGAELRDDPVTGLSLFASLPIATDERLISCPFSLAITPELATAAIEAVTGVGASALVWPAESARAGEKWNERMLVAAYFALHWRCKDKVGEVIPNDLKHAQYIAALPDPSTLTTPLYYSEAERSLLAGTNLLGAVTDREAEWESERAVVVSVLSLDALTWERYLAVATYLSSRAFPSALLKLPAGQSTEGKTAGDEEVSHPVLIPGLDMLNHARGRPITWLSSPIPRAGGGDVEAISFVAAVAQEANTQIFNNYGAKSNESLLLAYGFVIPVNPDDTVVLRLGTGSVPPEVKARLDAKGLNAGEQFMVGRDGELPRRLLEVVRVLLGNPAHAHGHSHSHGDEDEDEDDEDEHAAHEKEMEELNLELDVLGMLGQMLETKLDKLSVEVDAEGARDEVVAAVQVYRQGQADILNAAIDKVGERVDRIEMLLEDGPECPCGC